MVSERRGGVIVDAASRWEITELLHRYGHVIDDEDWDALTEIYHEDMVLDLSSLGLEVVSGRDAVIAHHRRPRPFATAHAFTTVLVGDDGRQIIARSKVVAPDDTGACHVSTIRDVVVRTDAGWRIKERRVERIVPAGARVGRS